MGKTHEALERAENEFQKSVGRGAPPAPPSAGKAKRPRRLPAENGAECYQSLKANLVGRYPGQAVRTIIFCSTAHGDGSTTTAANFALTLARDCRLKVLLVDANLRTPYLHDLFSMDRSPGLSDVVTNGAGAKKPWMSPTLPNLHVLPCGTNHSGPLGLFESARFDQFLSEAREEFNYVILDAPPIPSFSEARVMCPKVDGVVLVVGAGKTRRQVAQRAKKDLEEAGGKVLGIVINRRKYHIPGWIYKRL
jgi:capsular exopolysaccharide synthesis family protein